MAVLLWFAIVVLCNCWSRQQPSGWKVLKRSKATHTAKSRQINLSAPPTLWQEGHKQLLGSAPQVAASHLLAKKKKKKKVKKNVKDCGAGCGEDPFWFHLSHHHTHKSPKRTWLECPFLIWTKRVPWSRMGAVRQDSNGENHDLPPLL